MKHTIIAGCLLALILLALVFNATFVSQATDELYSKLKTLPTTKENFEADGEKVSEELYEMWNGKRLGLSYTINEDELDRIDEALAELCGACKSGDFETYYAAKERLMSFIPTLADGEKPTLKNIF